MGYFEYQNNPHNLPRPVPNIQSWGVFCFSLIAQAAAQLCMEQMGEGTLHFFFCLKAAEPQKKPYWFFCQLHNCCSVKYSAQMIINKTNKLNLIFKSPTDRR